MSDREGSGKAGPGFGAALKIQVSSASALKTSEVPAVQIGLEIEVAVAFRAGSCPELEHGLYLLSPELSL
jgi:hypothetical protein